MLILLLDLSSTNQYHLKNNLINQLTSLEKRCLATKKMAMKETMEGHHKQSGNTSSTSKATITFDHPTSCFFTIFHNQ